MSKKKEMSRRKFLTEVAAGGAACAIVPRHVLGRGYTPPSDMLNIAGVGVGGMGRNNLINLATQNIVALCDADGNEQDEGEICLSLQPRPLGLMQGYQDDAGAILLAGRGAGEARQWSAGGRLR